MHRHRFASTVVAVVAVTLVASALAGPALAVGPAVAAAGTNDAIPSTDGAVGSQGIETQVSTVGTAQEDLNCEYPLTVTDGFGTSVEVDEEPSEVVALAPNVAQHIWELGAESKVTGMPVNQWTAYLNGSENRTHVLEFDESAGLSLPDTEQIVDLNPDIVLASNVIPADAVTELRDSGLTVYHYDAASDLDSMMSLFQRTGQLVGACDAAENVTASMTETIDQIQTAVSGEDQPRILYDSGFGSTVSEGALEHDIISAAGAENVAADVGDSAYPTISAEFVVSQDPDWILTTDGAGLSDFEGYNSTTARQEGQVIEVDGNLISQHGPRNIDVLETIATTLHPEAMAEIPDGNDTNGNGTNETDGENQENETNQTEDSDGNGAGLTAVGAVVALAAVTLVAARRRTT